MQTLILQSAPPAPPAWLARCMASVRGWCAAQGHAYRLLGDELFDAVPADIVARFGGGARIPKSDLGRLTWIARLLDEGWGRVMWIDADVILFDPAAMTLPPDVPYACAREHWLWHGAEGIAAREAVTNALLLFSTRAGLLDWYAAQAVTILREAPLPLNRIALGPQLLTDLHAVQPLPLIESVATLSPLLMAEIHAGGGPALAAHRAAWTHPVAGAHLCRSLGQTRDGPALVPANIFDPVIDRLLTEGTALLNA